MNTSRSAGGGTGTQTAAIAFGGNLQPGYTNVTETWNGSNWTTVPATLNRPASGGIQAAGTTTASLAFGGTPPAAGATEEWSGSSNVTKVLTD